MKNYKGSILLLRRTVGFSVGGLDEMLGGASLEETTVGSVLKTRTIMGVVYHIILCFHILIPKHKTLTYELYYIIYIMCKYNP